MPTFVVVHIDILPYIRYHTHILFMTHYTTYPLVVLTINFPSISHKSPYTFNFDFYFSFPLYMTINTSVTYYNQLNRNPSAETTTSLHHYNYFHIIYTHPPPISSFSTLSINYNRFIDSSKLIFFVFCFFLFSLPFIFRVCFCLQRQRSNAKMKTKIQKNQN